jgi:hypothetical protein
MIFFGPLGSECNCLNLKNVKPVSCDSLTESGWTYTETIVLREFKEYINVLVKE